MTVRVCVMLTLFLWVHVWSTSWQTQAYRIWRPAALSHPVRHHWNHLKELSKKSKDSLKKNRKEICVWVCFYLYGLIDLVRSRGGRYSHGHGRWHGELSGSSPRLSRAVQWQRQEVGRSDRMDTISRECTGATEHSTELPTWHTEQTVNKESTNRKRI